MKTITKKKHKTEKSEIKYCSDFNEECAEIDPAWCFIGGVWVCNETGRAVNMPLADGVCKEMERREK